MSLPGQYGPDCLLSVDCSSDIVGFMETSNPTRTARTAKFQAKNEARKSSRVGGREGREAREARRNYTDGTFGSDRLPVVGAFGKASKGVFNELVVGTSGTSKDGE